MSESAARAERRDLRRAMGPHVQAFASDTKQAIQTLQAGISTLEHEHGKLVRDVEAKHQAVCGVALEVNDRQRRFEARTLRDRLRWLLTGR